MNITISFLKSLPIFSRNLDFKVQTLKKNNNNYHII